MSEARNVILSAIRLSLKRGPLCGEFRAPLEERIRSHPRQLIPSRVDVAPDALVELFIAKARIASASVVEVHGWDDIPQAVADYLASENLPARLVQAPGLSNLDWSLVPALQVRAGAAQKTDEVSLSKGLAGVAETGTLVLASGSDSPTTLNFVPPTHLVVLFRKDVVGAYEDAWDRLRATGDTPRTVNFITGPSRTGDIEQQIQIGVHGPLRLHLILVGR